MRIDTNSLNIQPTGDPAIVLISGRATEDADTITNDKKTWYSFELRWNINQAAKEFGSTVSSIIEDKKPKKEHSDLKTALIAGNKKILVDMTGEEPVQEVPS